MKRENTELLENGADRLGVSLSGKQLTQFDLFLQELQEWNQKLNLTAITEEREIVIKHFLDSLSCLLSNKIAPGNLLVDIGSGAGFPGIPLAIARPDIEVSLVEASRKKAEFLRRLLVVLGLEGRVLGERAEGLARSHERGRYDVAVARAISTLSVICEYGLPFLKKGGYLIAQKSQRAKEEMADAQAAARLLGGGIPQLVSVALPYEEAERYLVLVEKIEETPERYPRRPGIPEKRPLGRAKDELGEKDKRTFSRDKE